MPFRDERAVERQSSAVDEDNVRGRRSSLRPVVKGKEVLLLVNDVIISGVRWMANTNKQYEVKRSKSLESVEYS